MFETQFLLEQGHFCINLIAAFGFFATSWLYFDAWLNKKIPRESIKFLGFLFLSFSFIAQATFIEQTLLQEPLLGVDTVLFLTSIFRLLGYILLVVGLILDPLQPKPSVSGLQPETFTKTSLFIPLGFSLSVAAPLFFPVFCLGIGFLYLRRAKIGLEAHLKPISFVFFILAFSEFLSLASLFRNIQNPEIANLVSPFGPFWLGEHLILFLTALFLAWWVFKYLLKRIQVQLFMVFIVSTVAIFLLTTVTFSFLLMRSLENDALGSLQTDASIFEYAISGKKGETLSDAQLVAQNPEVQKAASEGDRPKLKEQAAAILLTKKKDFLVIVSQTGEVLARGEDWERIGDSLSGDLLVKRALSGEGLSSIVTKEGVLAPEVSIRSAAPIKVGESVLGAVVVGVLIDNAFVDGVKEATKLDVSIYGQNIRSATTFVSPDGKSRWVGLAEETPAIKKAVFDERRQYRGSVSILNNSYLAAFAPLEDIDNNVVGMLFVGKPQVSVLQSAGRAIELTFIVAALLMVLSVIPAYLMSRYIAYQIK